MSKKKPVRSPRKSTGKGKFFLSLLVLAAAVGGFVWAERAELTGTHFFFREEAGGDAPDQAEETKEKAKGKKNARPSSAGTGKNADDGKGKDVRGKDAAKQGGKSSGTTKKKTSGTAATSETIPDFAVISVRKNTWPTFVKLTRARNISLSDPKTGISMGRMDIPAGTVVKVRNVGPTGTLVVLDRTGQTFQVSAAGTNFSEAYLAKKNKPKKPKVVQKKPAPKKPKVAAKSDDKPEPPPEPASSSSSEGKRLSAFGVFETSDWDEDDED